MMIDKREAVVVLGEEVGVWTEVVVRERLEGGVGRGVSLEGGGRSGVVEDMAMEEGRGTDVEKSRSSNGPRFHRQG